MCNRRAGSPALLLKQLIQPWSISLVSAAGKSSPTQANGTFVTNAAIVFVPSVSLIIEANTAVVASNAANAHTDI